MLRALQTLRPQCLTATSGRFPAPVESVLRPASCVWYPPWRRSTPVSSLHMCSALCAGHNKWSKVKHIKGPKDEARGRMFMKFGMLIKIAVKGEIQLKQSHVFQVFSCQRCGNLNVGFTCRGWIQPRHEFKLSPHTGAVQKQEHAQSVHRGCNQECGRLTTQSRIQMGEMQCKES